jgi:putative efflux protein, MATE family
MDVNAILHLIIAPVLPVHYNTTIMSSNTVKTTDMTSGDVTSLLIRFSLPLLAGNLFQQLYNTVDSIVVGNYVGKEALAAVGSTTSLINTLVGFFLGLAAGASVVISQYFGARDQANLRKTVHTMMAGTLILGVLFTILGIICSPYLLRLMATPDDVLPDATVYLRIYFEGVLALMIYNTGSGILRAVGDSKRPLYFLIVSSLINVVLDLVFVIVFHWGIAGAAYATIIAEGVSAVMVICVLVRTKECYRLKLSELRVSVPILRRILALGLPAGIQQAVTSFSNVFVQAYINGFGSSCMAGWASYGKIDQFAILPMQSLSLASTTFVGQNFGAHNFKRAKRGITTSLVISATVTGLLVIPLAVFARQLVSMFNREPDVLYYGSFFLRISSPFYVLCCINQIYAGALRGLGDAAVPMGIMIGSFVVFRQIYLFTVTHLTSSFYPVSVAYPVGWVVCSAVMFLHYRNYMKKHGY